MKKFLKKNWSTILIVLAFFVGIGLLLYPTIADWWNSYHQTRAIVNYDETVENLSDDEYETMLEEAEAFNEWLNESHTGGFSFDEEETEYYESVLDVTGTGIMAYLEIAKIDVYLPIYHGTGDSVLQVGIGHLEGSSLPIGGTGTHAVLSGHRGLTSARLLTDLDEMEVGDTFIIHTLGETLTYEVDQILIVLPTETGALSVDPDEDYVTLMTCTPYGINTHRLLVRGHRVENASDVSVTADATQLDTTMVASVIAAIILIILFVWVMLRGRRKKRKKTVQNMADKAAGKNAAEHRDQNAQGS